MNIDYTNDGLHLLGKGYFEMGRERKTLYYTEMKKVLFLFLSLFCYTCLWAQKKVKVTYMENGITYGARIENREAESYSTRLQVSDLYTDNMVLQRDVPLKIHGKANVGELVSVSIAQQKVTARVDNNGRWFVLLTPLQAGGPYTLSISTGKQTLSYKNVLVGEVWLCSGQSNMEFMLKQAATAQTDIPEANDDKLRLFDMKARWRTNAVAWNASVLDSLNHLHYYKSTVWKSCTSATAASFSAVAYYFGKMLRDSLNVPVGLICNAVGGSPTEAWIDRHTLDCEFPDILYDWTKNDFIQDWVRKRAALNIKHSTNKQQRHPYEPCFLFESGILPLSKYPLKGVIWYQGESNTHNKEAHEKLFKLLIDSWRSNWEQPNLPFYYVQLSSIDRPSWTWFRDSQRRLMKSIPNTGMVVSSDQGDSLDVHPINKKPIGERLGYWALNRTYGYENVLPSGPLFRSAEFRDGAVYVSFDYGDGLHSVDGAPLCAFEVAEEEGFYEPATAIVEDNCLKVYNTNIKNPRFIRYGWQPFTRANLVNNRGLPASTFRVAASAACVIIDKVSQMQGFPQENENFAKGVSACYAGIAAGKLLIAGGCNFPKIPVHAGGSKKYYRDIYTAELSKDSVLVWQRAGQLPQAMAYGVSVSTADGIICVGGMNEQAALSTTYRIRVANEKAVVETLPSLPCTLDNMTGALLENKLYVVGGNKDGKASNAFYCLDLEQLSQGWQELPAFPGVPRVQPVSAAQLDADGQLCFYLWSGFAAPTEERDASLSVDGYVYSPAANTWTPLPEVMDEVGETVSLSGGVATAWDKNLIICMGGVDKDIFLRALQKTAADYLTHPVEWYRFNKRVLVYDVRLREWQTIACIPDVARAGAALVVCGENIFCINGELKPGVRTPEITCITIKK